MKILRVYHARLEPGHGERDAALLRQGVEVTAVAPTQWPGATSLDAHVVQLPVKRAGDINRHTYADPAAIVELAARLDVDLVDLQEEPVSAVTHQLTRVLPARLPVVAYTAQNIDKRWPPPFHQWERAALHRLAGSYPCSRQAASVVRGKGFAGEVTVLPLGVDTTLLTPGDQRHDSPVFELAMIGRLIPRKGVLDAVRVLHRVLQERTTHLTLVGTGSDTAPAQELAAQLGVSDALTVLPWADPVALADLYRRTHVVLVPSKAIRTWVEQFGRVVTEGRACGAVPVGYASGSLPEVIGDSGLLVPEEDVPALGAALAKLATDKDAWESLRTKGLSSSASWDDVAARQVAFYERVLAGGTRNASGRNAAVAEFGEPARIAGGGRPFALPLLRENNVGTRFLERVLDTVTRG